MREYEIIRSDRRTTALEITRAGQLLVRAPRRVSAAQIETFVRHQEAWIEAHLALQRQRAAQSPPPPTPAEIEVLKARARALLPQKVHDYSEKMGLVPTGIKITSARHRYGSCNSRGGVCFSCFLMEYPDEAIDLVVVHELCHLKEHNHGPRFYALLERYLPDYRERKKLLR